MLLAHCVNVFKGEVHNADADRFRVLVPSPNVPDVNLRHILMKIHKRLSEPFDRYW